MKNLKTTWIYLCIATLALSSCSKDEQQLIPPEEVATLSFNMIIQDLTRQSLQRQSIADIPECSDDTPFFVEIILSQDGTDIVGSSEAPFRLDLASNQLFTQYAPELELVPGDYSLDHFSVHNAGGDLLWLAPKTGGAMALYSSDPLPIDIELKAGTKPYIDVPVLCYDNRDVNEYGYLFFELDAIPIIEYCFFANYCSDSGRHYPARYSIDVSINGISIYTDEINKTGINEQGDNFAEPLCIALPDLAAFDDDEEYIQYTITLLPWEGLYEIDEEMEISGSLSREDIMDLFDGEENVDYEHIYFNCEDSGEGNGEVPDELPDVSEAQFSNPTNITNPYYGPATGLIYEYVGFELEDGEVPDEPSEVIVIERRLETKVVMGINTIIQRDYVEEDGVIIEDTDDWLAQDDDGNLWYFGEDSKNFDDEGNFIDNEGSWEAGIDGALPGYWIPGNPEVGDLYYQEWYEGEAEDYAIVVALNETVTIEMGTFENVLVTQDVNPFEEGVYELKYYAPGIGLILEEKYEDDELVEIVYLAGIIVID